MMEIIVVGATGFIGQNLVYHLEKQGNYQITAVSRNGGSVFRSKGLRFDRLDSYDPSSDAIVVNLAACRYNATNLSNQHILLDNVDIVGRVYRFCADHKIREVRQFSSISVYPADEDRCGDNYPIDLRRPPHKGEIMYGWAKRIGEVYADLFKSEYDINTVTFRPTSPYGPFDSLDINKAHVIPTLIMRALADSKPLLVRGNPAATRDFIFVEDICRIVEDSLTHKAVHSVYNLGSGTTISIRELAQRIVNCIDPRRTIEFLNDSFNPVTDRSCDISKLIDDFIDPEQFTPLCEGLLRTVEWVKARAGA